MTRGNFNRYLLAVLLLIAMGAALSIAFNSYQESSQHRYTSGTYPGTGKLYSPQLVEAYYNPNDKAQFITTYNFAEFLIARDYISEKQKKTLKTPADILKTCPAIPVADVKTFINNDELLLQSIQHSRDSATRTESLLKFSSGTIFLFILLSLMSSGLNKFFEWAGIKRTSSQLNKEIDKKIRKSKDELEDLKKEISSQTATVQSRNINISDLAKEIRELKLEKNSQNEAINEQADLLKKAQSRYDKLEEKIAEKKAVLKKLPKPSDDTKKTEAKPKSIVKLFSGEDDE